MVSVSATNKKKGEAIDGIGIQIGACLINRWKDRINREGLYNKDLCAKERGLPDQGVLRKGEV